MRHHEKQWYKERLAEADECRREGDYDNAIRRLVQIIEELVNDQPGEDE